MKNTKKTVIFIITFIICTFLFLKFTTIEVKDIEGSIDYKMTEQGEQYNVQKLNELFNE